MEGPVNYYVAGHAGMLCKHCATRGIYSTDCEDRSRVERFRTEVFLNDFVARRSGGETRGRLDAPHSMV